MHKLTIVQHVYIRLTRSLAPNQLAKTRYPLVPPRSLVSSNLSRASSSVGSSHSTSHGVSRHTPIGHPSYRAPVPASLLSPSDPSKLVGAYQFVGNRLPSSNQQNSLPSIQYRDLKSAPGSAATPVRQALPASMNGVHLSDKERSDLMRWLDEFNRSPPGARAIQIIRKRGDIKEEKVWTINPRCVMPVEGSDPSAPRVHAFFRTGSGDISAKVSLVACHEKVYSLDTENQKGQRGKPINPIYIKASAGSTSKVSLQVADWTNRKFERYLANPACMPINIEVTVEKWQYSVTTRIMIWIPEYFCGNFKVSSSSGDSREMWVSDAVRKRLGFIEDDSETKTWRCVAAINDGILGALYRRGDLLTINSCPNSTAYIRFWGEEDVGCKKMFR